jgi:tetratricopeptide (TPR) repeat protein
MDDPTELLSENESQTIFEKTRLSKKSFILLPYDTSLLKGDLDNIILKSLRKEPSRRYSSVEDLSKDISNYLNGLPVTARPNTFWYRSTKFFARNKTASIVGILLILSLILGIITTAWQAVIARRERDLAQQRFNDVRRLSNSLLFEITPKIERLQGSTEAREILVKRALEYLDSLAAVSQNDVSLQSELASAYEKVGDVQGNPAKPNLGNLEGGIESYLKAQKIRLELAAQAPDDLETQRLLANNYNSIGDFRWWGSQIEEAFSDYENSIGILEKSVQKQPENLQMNIDLVSAISNKTKVISYNGNYDEALKEYEATIAKIEALERNFPANVELNRLKALALIRTAYDLSWQNRYDILGKYVEKSFALYESNVANNPNDARLRRDLYFAYFQAGGIYVEADPALSRRYIEKSIEIAKKTVEIDKVNYLAKFDLAQSYSKLGEIYQIEKNYAPALEFLNKAGEILTEISLSEPKHDGYKFSLANNFARIAAVQAGKGEFQKAVENYQKAIAGHEELRALDKVNVMPIRAIAVASQDLADLFVKLGQNNKALENYQKSVEMFTALDERKGLSNYDKQFFEKSQKAVENLLMKNKKRG